MHLGNLRTALVAWLSARSSGGQFLIRSEDLDTVTSSREHEIKLLEDLADLGFDWDGDVVRQSERFDLYDAAIDRLVSAGRVYECLCTRREIREAASAPHGDSPDGAYPGTCRDLTESERQARRESGRLPALRLRTDGELIEFKDGIAGWYRGMVDDVVLRRNDGVPAYNLAVVVDDAVQGVTEVVRGDDLLSSTPRQLLLIDLLGFAQPAYCHVPLVMAPDGNRLAKRHGAVTLPELIAAGLDHDDVRGVLAWSLGLAERGERPTMAQLVEQFSIDHMPTQPWVLDPKNVVGLASQPGTLHG
jgi:glutamyl-tRNA synthetase